MDPITTPAQAPEAAAPVTPAVETPQAPEAAADKFDALLANAGKRMSGGTGPGDVPQAAPQDQPPPAGQAPEVTPTAPAAPADDLPAAPGHWPDDVRADYDALPPEGKRIFMRRHREMEAGFNRRMQQVAEAQNRLGAYDGLIRAMESDPGLLRHIQGYGQGQVPSLPAQEAQRPSGAPQSPLEQFQAETEARVQAAVEKRLLDLLGPMAGDLGSMKQRLAAETYTRETGAVLDTVRKDPLNAQVMGSLKQALEMLPGEVVYIQASDGRVVVDPQASTGPRGQMAYELDVNPAALREHYAYHRELVSKRQGGTPQAQAPAQRQTPAAPVLESSESAPAPDAGGQQEVRNKQEHAAITKRIRNGQAGPGDLAAYLLNTGAAARMVRR